MQSLTKDNKNCKLLDTATHIQALFFIDVSDKNLQQKTIYSHEHSTDVAWFVYLCQLSVTLLRCAKRLNGSRSCLGGNSRGFKAHCIRRGTDPLHCREGEIIRCGLRQITFFSCFRIRSMSVVISSDCRFRFRRPYSKLLQCAKISVSLSLSFAKHIPWAYARGLAIQQQLD